MRVRLSRRLFFATIHFSASAAIFAILALVVFGFWYPPPFDRISGGLHLLAILFAVDVVLGPMLTAIIAAPDKTMPHLRRDLTLIVVVQLCALGYGTYVLVDARPAWVSFERVQFRIVAAGEIESSQLADAPPALRRVPWAGPKLIAAVLPADPTEQFRSMEQGLAGFDLSYFPRNWREYESQAARAWSAARPASELVARYPAQRQAVERIALAAGMPLEQLGYLPMRTKFDPWSVLIVKPQAKIVGYLPVDGEP